MKTMNEIIEEIYTNCKCICSDTHEQFLSGYPLPSEEYHLEDDDENPIDYDNYFLYKDKYEAYKKANECSEIRWIEFVEDSVNELGFTEEELKLGYYYINKTLYPEAQLVRAKHVRRGTI